MKRFISVVLITTLAVGTLVGCSGNKKKDTSDPVAEKFRKEVSTDTSFKLGNNDVKLPCTIKDLNSIGYSFKNKKDNKKVINPKFQSDSVILVNKDGKEIKVYFGNNTEGVLYCKDCSIFRVYSCIDNGESIKIKDIEFGTDLKTVKEKLGEPDQNVSTSEKDEYKSATYYMNKKKKSDGKVTFIFKNDKVYSVDISKVKETEVEESSKKAEKPTKSDKSDVETETIFEPPVLETTNGNSSKNEVKNEVPTVKTKEEPKLHIKQKRLIK